MDGWISFAGGPLFRLCFTLLLLGLLRAALFSLSGMFLALRRAGDRRISWGVIGRKTVDWMVPVRRLWRVRPVYSTISFIWHIGLLLVPLFLAAHVNLWRQGMGFAWLSLPQVSADILTWLAIGGAVALFLGRVGNRTARALSRRQDYLWPILLLLPFTTGALCSQIALAPRMYQALMLTHLLSANLVMVLIPFSKVAHCALLPMSQMVSVIGWKFQPGTGDRVAATLGKPAMPVEKLVTTPAPRSALKSEPVVEEVTA